jgi:hypothetical protein
MSVMQTFRRKLDSAIDSISSYIKDPQTGTAVSVNSEGQMHVVLRGSVCDACSTSTPLTAGDTFTGTAVNTLDYGIIFVTIYTDQDSATDGLGIEQSSDGINWDITDNYTIQASCGKTFSLQPAARYIRVTYTNGTSDQTEFRLQTVLKKTNSLPSSHRIQDSILDDDDATLQKSVLTAKKDTGDFTNIGATASGNLRTTNAEDNLAIAKGDVTGTSFIHKFGQAPDFDETDGSVTVWDGANNSDIAEMRYIYSTTAAIDSISSSDAGDTVDIEIQGLDSNYDLVTQTVTLNGQTRVALTTNLIRVFRMINVGSTDLVGYVYCYENTAITAGTPNDTSKIRAVINNVNNRTLMAIYTIPAGYTGYMRDWYSVTAGESKSSQYIIRLKARPFGQVFQLKHITSISDTATSHLKNEYIGPEVFEEKTDIEMRVEATENGVSEASIAAGFDIVLVAN